MGSTTAYQCDGPGCTRLTTRAAGARKPDGYLRVQLTLADGTKTAGGFHDAACALEWLAAQFVATPEEA